MAVKVMLVDDHPLFLEGLQNLLEVNGIEVVGTAVNGNQAIIKACALKPDVILMDIAMPVCSGLDAIVPIKSELPDVKIVMLTSFDNDENLFEAIQRGASGYLLKNLNAAKLVSFLNTLEQGELPLSPGLADRLLKEFAQRTEYSKNTGPKKSEGKLNARQTEVLNMVARGLTYKEVGAALNISERTVKYHMDRILELLQLENRAQAIAYSSREKKENT